jgi:hypothetical protein
MDEIEIKEIIQDVANVQNFEVKDIERSNDTIVISQTDLDEQRTVIFAATLFDQIDADFNTIAFDEHGSERGPVPIPREAIEDEMQRWVALFNSQASSQP